MAEVSDIAENRLEVLQGPITYDYLKSTVFDSPVEIGIYRNKEKKLVLTAGTQEEAAKMSKQETEKSPFTYHSHPLLENIEEVPDSPSFIDIYALGTQPNKSHFIGHKEGVVEFKFKGEEDDWQEKTVRFLNSKGVGFGYSQGVRNGSLKDIDNISLDMQIKLARDFSEESGIIISRTPWEDRKGVQKILNKINSSVDKI